MPVALIIGASRGIGKEFVHQLLQDGWKVYATARDNAALDALREAGAQTLRLDVSKPESLATLSWQLDGVKLDLAVYVAGVLSSRNDATEPPTVADFDAVMHTNVLGAMQAIPMVVPFVESGGGKFVFISSSMGSIADASSSYAWVYRASKAALNMAVKSAAATYPKTTMLVMNPGWVRTDMGGENAGISVEQSVSDMRRALSRLSVRDSGSFYNYDGRQLPW